MHLVERSHLHSYKPSLYVVTQHNQPHPKCKTKSLSDKQQTELRKRHNAPTKLKSTPWSRK